MYWSTILLGLILGPAEATTEVATESSKPFESYTQAWHAAKEMHRPMLVILNPAGEAAADQAIDGQKLQENANLQPLLDNYVVAVIDTGTEHGKKVQELFGDKQLPRVVVIDKEQKRQIFGSSGVMPQSRLAEVLTQYRNGNSQPVTSFRISDTSSSIVIPGDCPNCRKNWVLQ